MVSEEVGSGMVRFDSEWHLGWHLGEVVVRSLRRRVSMRRISG
jgi:hypothetical protein